MANKMATRQKIMTAFIELLSKQGYAATTTKQIAATAGVNESTIYRHFDGKWALVEEFVAQERRAMSAVAKKFAPRYELAADLAQFSTLFHQSMIHQQIIWQLFTTIRNQEQAATLHRELVSGPGTLMTVLCDYFAEMRRRRLILPTTDEKVAAVAFIWLNVSQTVANQYGYLTGFEISDEGDFNQKILAGFVRSLATPS